MARRVTHLTGMDPTKRRRTLALALASCNGNVKRAAHYLGIHRSYLYRLLHKDGLFGVVNETRRQRVVDRLQARRLKDHGINS